MLWFPVKKIRKQFKLLLLLVLLTFAVWFTYLHINLVRQGKALRLHFAYGRADLVLMPDDGRLTSHCPPAVEEDADDHLLQQLGSLVAQ
ncbi:N-acetyl-beta-glucosaminyl-glycoprotein 4-beta-N-acetylgalactosaminyltransferase 1 [Crotalus adamanteus]|uniref:N-acetyl-beta-glucosaminyl-glycoprotein 4-beta-N-acetylgalactosaminyltransferase 1 n=1 Tax=Crotalus adamanteus TaxID=8729 RepID=A0AAW1C8M5_CROAD